MLYGNEHVWNGSDGEWVRYHEVGDYWTWRDRAGVEGSSDMSECVLAGLGLS